MNEQPLTRALGVFSLGLGAAVTAAPGAVANAVGAGDGPTARTILRLVGVRGIVCGAGILAQRRPVGWVWARVAGDVMDLSLTTTALVSDSRRKHQGRLLGTLAASIGITATDLYTAMQLSRRAAGQAEGGGLAVKRTVTVLRSPEEVYRYWHDFTNLPSFMDHLESVQVLGGNLSHWKAKAPAGTTVEWDAEIVEDRPNQRISWRSLPGATVPNSGTVHFVPAPGGRGTEIHVELRYNPPGGRLGKVAATIFGEEPAQQVRDDIGRFKQIMETGQITVSDATAKGFGPARPPEKTPPPEARPSEPTRRPEPALP